MPITPNTANLAEHIGQYVTLSRKPKPEKIVSATKSEVKTESGERIRFTPCKNWPPTVTQIGASSFSPKILTDEEAAKIIESADIEKRRSNAAAKAYKAADRLRSALYSGPAGFTAEQLTEIADKINAMFGE